MVFSDGVWYDPADGLFKMWYMGGYATTTCYATSKDGLHWEKPALDVEPGTNIVLAPRPRLGHRLAGHRRADPERRFKMFTRAARHGRGLGARAPHFRRRHPLVASRWPQPPSTGDRTTVFYNPSARSGCTACGAALAAWAGCGVYREHPDPSPGARWQDRTPRSGSAPTGSIRTTPSRAERRRPAALQPRRGRLREPDARGCSRSGGEPANRGFQKLNEVLLGFSRDGFHWYRPDRRPFAGVNETEGAWNWGNVQSAGGGCLVVGDKLYFYVSGRQQSRTHRRQHDRPGHPAPRRFRLDGRRRRGGHLTTRPVRFRGKHLFVNVDAPQGELRAEVLDAKRPA